MSTALVPATLGGATQRDDGDDSCRLGGDLARATLTGATTGGNESCKLGTDLQMTGTTLGQPWQRRLEATTLGWRGQAATTTSSGR